jgi:hypothetical protein
VKAQGWVSIIASEHMPQQKHQCTSLQSPSSLADLRWCRRDVDYTGEACTGSKMYGAGDSRHAAGRVVHQDVGIVRLEALPHEVVELNLHGTRNHLLLLVF